MYNRNVYELCDDKKIRVLHVPFGGLGHGGVTSVIFSIIESLHEQISFDSVVFNKCCENEEAFLKYGNLHRIKCYPGGSLPNILELVIRPFVLFFGVYNLCKTEKYDVIHCHNEPEEGICLLAARFAKIKTRIAHSHNTPSPLKKGIFKRVRDLISKMLINWNATVRIGCSDMACRYLFGEKEYNVIINAVDLKKFDSRKRTTSIDDCIRFVHVGRYTYQKNQKFIIDVFSHIHDMIPNCNLKLVGFGEDKDALQEKINRVGLNDVIDLIPGNQVDISDVFANGDYMIFPSNYEGFGIVLIEAQAMGCFCFTSDVVQNEADAGLIMKIPLSKSAESWGNIICDFISSNKLSEISAAENSLQKYSKESVVAKYEKIYRCCK